MFSCLNEKDESLCSVLEHDGGYLSLWDGYFPVRMQQKCSRKKLRELSYDFASALAALGAKHGEPTAILLPNFLEFAVAYFGILRSGGIASPINIKLSDFEIETILRKSSIKRVVVLDKFYPLVSKIETLENIIVLRVSDALPLLKGAGYFFKAKRKNTWIDISHEDSRVCDFYTFLNSGRISFSNSCTKIRKSDEALILFTSGTTGAPKGIVHTQGSLLENTYACRELFYELVGGTCGEKEVFLAAAPYFHIMGLSTMLHLPLLTGSKIIMTFPFPGEDFGSKLVRAISLMKVSVFVGTPLMYELMLNCKATQSWGAFDFSALKVCISGSIKMSDNIRAKFEKTFNKKIIEGYGMSETGITHCQKENFNFVDSVGTTLRGVEHKLINVDKDRVGEVLVRSKGLMKEYRDESEDLKKEVFIDEDGWLHTGDLGCISKNSELFLTDRKKDLIKGPHGENIHPSQIEHALQSHHLIKEVAVVGRKVDGREEVVAFVVLKLYWKSKEEVQKELFEICKTKLSSIKIPKEINFIAELPKNFFGKVLKKELK